MSRLSLYNLLTSNSNSSLSVLSVCFCPLLYPLSLCSFCPGREPHPWGCEQVCDRAAGGRRWHAGPHGGGHPRTRGPRGPHHQRRDGELRARRLHGARAGVHQAAIRDRWVTGWGGGHSWTSESSTQAPEPHSWSPERHTEGPTQRGAGLGSVTLAPWVMG